MWSFRANECGEITALSNKSNKISMQEGAYAGPSLVVSKEKEQQKIKMEVQSLSDTQMICVGWYEEVKCILQYDFTEDMKVSVRIENQGNDKLDVDKISIRLGIDHYMATYPEWNDILFPTMHRCEKDCYWGYFMSPNGMVLAVGSPDTVRSWELNYNKVNADNYGHRIYTSDLVLFQKEEQPTRHTEDFRFCESGKSYQWDFTFALCETVEDVPEVCAEITGAAIVQMEKYTLDAGEVAKGKLFGDGEVTAVLVSPSQRENKANIVKAMLSSSDEDGKGAIYKFQKGEFSLQMGEEQGEYSLLLLKDGKVSEVSLYVAMDVAWYMENAKKNAIEKPQKASTHLESWYGFFSMMLQDKHCPGDDLKKNQQWFDTCFFNLYDKETLEPLIEPERVNNTAVTISLLVDAYEAYGDKKYIDYAMSLADFMMKHQIADGSYRAYLFTHAFDEEVTGNGIHYTAVLYPIKSMLELIAVEEVLGESEPKYKEGAKKHLISAIRAADNLALLKDNIDTEGEITFEDGMISCAALQLGALALYLQEKLESVGQEKISSDIMEGLAESNKSLKQQDWNMHTMIQTYTDAAVELMAKHRCLEQMIVPDCKRTGGTLRFWEAQYDVLLDGNMLNSPHGWTSWKNYATYYLYLLTGEIKYLRDTMNTLHACMQMIDKDTEELRWAFICDPCIPVHEWEVGEAPEYHTTVARTIGEQYVKMISGWWKALDEKPIGAYPRMPLRIRDGVVPCKNIGGCCDNDVHEHFKCMEEVLLCHGFVAECEDGSYLSYHCKIEMVDGVLYIVPNEDMVTKIHVNVKKSVDVHVEFAQGIVEKTVMNMEWIS